MTSEAPSYVLWFAKEDFVSQVELSGKIDNAYLGAIIFAEAIHNRSARRCKITNIKLKRTMFPYALKIV